MILDIVNETNLKIDLIGDFLLAVSGPIYTDYYSEHTRSCGKKLTENLHGKEEDLGENVQG